MNLYTLYDVILSPEGVFKLCHERAKTENKNF